MSKEALEARVKYLEAQLNDWVNLCHKQNVVIEELASKLEELLTLCDALQRMVTTAPKGKIPSA